MGYDDDLGFLFVNEVHEQRVEADNFDILEVAKNFGGHLDTLGQREAWLLRRALGNSQDQLVEQRRRAADEILVAPGDRVESARIDGNAMIEFVQAVFPPVSRRSS